MFNSHLSSVSDFQLTNPPPHLLPYQPSSHRLLNISYARHPHYCGLDPSPLRSFTSLFAFCSSLFEVAIKRSLFFVRLSYDERKSKPYVLPYFILRNLLLRFRGFFNGTLLSPALSSKSSFVYNSLLTNGISVVSSSGLIEPELDQIVSSCLNDLRYKRASFGPGSKTFDQSRHPLSRASHKYLYKLFTELFTASGIIDAASLYLNRQVTLIDINPQINDSTDDFWKLDSFGSSVHTSQQYCDYFHKDALGDSLKVIMYCNSVTTHTSGPFSYCIGSHRKIPFLMDLFASANDLAGFSGTSYSARQNFMSLPSFLRFKGSFGNDVPTNSPLGCALIDSEWQVKSGKYSLVIFDPKGIHRGGMVTQGERLVITSVLA